MDQRQSNKNLIELIHQGIDSKKNLEQLFNDNHGFIYLVIRKRVHGIYEEEDLFQTAFIALVKAVEYYDITRPLGESNFLQLLKWSIYREISNLTNNVPAYMMQKIINYKKTYIRLCNELDRKPKTFEMMLELDISIDELKTVKAAMQIPLSFDEPIGDEGDTTRLDLYAETGADESIRFDDNLERDELKKIIREAIETLPEGSKNIIDERYFQNKTLVEIAHERNVSKERIRQIETKALWSLRRNEQFKKKVIDYTSLNEYKNVGSRQFNTTKTSAVEWLVLEREKIKSREQEISLWLK